MEKDELPDGRVKAVTCGLVTVCMTHLEGRFAALDNKCPHQGGPLGEGSIENGLLRCPWHGWDYDPISGKAPGFDDGVETYPIEVREDGIYVAIEEEVAARAHGHRRDGRDAGRLGRAPGLRHGRTLEPRAGRRAAAQEQAGKLAYYGIRHEGAAAFAASAYGKLTGRPGRLPGDRGARRDEPPDRVCGTPTSTAHR